MRVKHQILENIFVGKEVKSTPLRMDIYTIVLAAKTPLSAYEILDKLRKKRPNAEPPTVYRVLDFLSDNKIIHRIESNNKYISCTHLENNIHEHHCILFVCNQCLLTQEYDDKDVLTALLNFAKKTSLKIDLSLLEVKGICNSCQKLAKLSVPK